MVRRHNFSPWRREAPELCMIFVPPKTEGAGKAGCRLHPWVPCNKKHGGRTTGSTGITPAFPAQWFTAYFVLSPVTGLFCHRRRAEVNLTPASGRQDHTTSPSAGNIARLASYRVHRIPHPTFVTIAKRPSCGQRNGGKMRTISDFQK